MRGAPAEPESVDPPAPTYTKSYTYDLAGNRTGFTLMQGSETIQELTYTYDTLNRLSSVSMDNVTQASYTYDANGNRVSLTYPNGVTETYTYNLANWVTGLTNSDGVETLSSFAYTYYASSNRKTETDHSGKTISYTYDGLGRLTQESETNGKTIGYSYDAAGNRTQMAVTGTEAYTTAYTYDANNRLLSETKTQNSGNTVTSYTYDANGNTLSKTVLAGNDPADVTAYSYNRFNQLTSVTAGGNPVYYSYNANGIRTAKLTNGIQTSFLLDGGDVVAELQNDVLYASYLRGVNLICRESNSAAEYYLFDAHADVVALTDETGAVTKSYEYDAFGCEATPDPIDANPFRYCGEYMDLETNTYYLRARNYSITIGRFLSEDPICYGPNWYIYCLNNPIILIDPSGLKDIAVRSTIEGLGGTVSWDSQTHIATVYLDGQSVTLYAGDANGSYIDNNGRMHTDDAWLFVALGSVIDLGKGWKGVIHRGTEGKDYQRHVHISNGNKMWSQNEDGSPHDKGNNSPGSPPKGVLRNLKEQKGWDWKEKEKDWLNKIDIKYMDSGYTIIVYPNGREVTVYKPISWYIMPYSPSTQQLRDYYYGPTYIDLGGRSTATDSLMPFIPMPNPVLIPVPVPAPIPILVW